MCKKKLKWIFILVILLSAAACFWYINDYYHSDADIQQYLKDDDMVKINEIKEGIFLDGPREDSAVIFYPGAKVEFTAYLPLLRKLADSGIDAFLVKMPCNFAFLGKNKADDIINTYNYQHWYLAGHSLGGAMAAVYASENLDRLDGLILLAAYPTKSLNTDNFSVVSIYGSEDNVLNMEKVKKGRDFVPSSYKEICIEGGNHAWFGNYSIQKGDGIASISHEEQQAQTVDSILNIIKENNGQSYN